MRITAVGKAKAATKVTAIKKSIDGYWNGNKTFIQLPCCHLRPLVPARTGRPDPCLLSHLAAAADASPDQVEVALPRPLTLPGVKRRKASLDRLHGRVGRV